MQLRVDIRTKIFRGGHGTPSHRALEDIRFAVKPNEFVCILGPSGCGKTTLLNLIAGLDRDFEGTIDRHGMDRAIGFVFQTPRLLPWRTLAENVRLALPRDEDGATRIAELLRETGLEKFRDAYPSRLSLGMQRRAALVRAFAVRPSLLLMDEPLVSLDQATAERIGDAMLALIERHPATVLYVTHDVEEAAKLGTRAVIFSTAPGRILADIAMERPPRSRGAEEIAAMAETIRRASHVP